MSPAVRYLILSILLAAWVIHPSAANATDRKTVVTSVVSAAVDKHYRRAKNKDGSYQPEYYALSLGGQAKDTVSHKSIDRVPRAEFEGLVKEQLAKQNYLMAPNADSASLLIHLLWGMTDPRVDNTSVHVAMDSAGSALAAYRATLSLDDADRLRGGFGGSLSTASPNYAEQRAKETEATSALMFMLLQQRDYERSLAPTASVLGYIDTVNDLSESPAIHAGLGTTYRDMWEEISERRYYVLVFAYDFKVLKEHKKLKALWVTRVSIRAQGNDFDEQLAAMIARAGRYFGRPTNGLDRAAVGRVEIGEAEVIGVVDDAPMKPASQNSDPSKSTAQDSAGPAVVPSDPQK